eukprot:6483546-Amphidinium_carterae.1
MSTAMSIDGDRANPQGNPTPPDSSSGVGTTVVGMGPIGTGIGTQCSVASDIPDANPHLPPINHNRSYCPGVSHATAANPCSK